MLTKSQKAAREGKITASFIPSLMAGNKDKILSEWRKLVGDPTYQEEDLSHNWSVQFGSYIEKFALSWHEKKTHEILIRRGEVVVHPDHPHISCTLDAFRPSDSTVIDCKAPGQWRKLDEVIQYYTPQMVVQRACVNADKTALLIVHGGSEPVEYPCEFDAAYEQQVFDRIAQFWKCVEDMTPPFAMEAALAPVPAIVEYDFSKDNAWCNEAGIWLENKEAAKKFTDAAANIKKAVPADGMKVTGGGIIVNRNKAGSLTIKEGK